MSKVVRKSLEWEYSAPVEIETGRLARQADGSVVLRVGETMMLATVVAKKDINPDVDFLPLSVDYRENYASTGKFPGGFFKRDGRLNEYEILTSRIVDRTLRPMFPEDYHGDIQVLVTVISSDRSTQPDALACVAASAALSVSDIPFPDPVATVRVGYKDGQYWINPTIEQSASLQMDIIAGGTLDSIVMVEGEMLEVSEEIMLEGLKRAHAAIQQLVRMQLELRAEVGKPTREYATQPVFPELQAEIEQKSSAKLLEICKSGKPKQERSAAFKTLRDEILAEYATREDYATIEKYLKNYFELTLYNVMRRMILEERVRLDNRKPDEIRPIWCEVAYLPRAHGSAIFTRGETQSLTTATLGTKLDEQTIDYATSEGSKKFMLQYNFPPFSTGEVKPMRAPGRREIGHGNLAERALKNVLPPDLEYTVRIVSDILESNGSSSMATVCAGTLALMDAGIQIKSPVSGIAMGLIIEDGKYAILSDILGDEDHLGDMDFKVAGTSNGLTACQMDIKVRGLSFEILANALAQGKAGRAHILGEMMKTITVPREDISAYAPRLMKMTIPQDTIGAVIGTGGKVIQEIQRETGTVITIEEIDRQGIVTVSSPNKEKIDAAIAWITGIVRQPEVGEIYTGCTVKNVREAGAYVEFLPGKDGWLHISEWDYARIDTMDSVVQVGDKVDVQYLGIDPKNNKHRLSRKALLPKPEGYSERPPRAERSDSGGGFRNDRSGGDWRGDRSNRGDRRR